MLCEMNRTELTDCLAGVSERRHDGSLVEGVVVEKHVRRVRRDQSVHMYRLLLGVAPDAPDELLVL
jgi:hypothetical protein